MKIYVTGVGGLIGSTVAEVAIRQGHKVWGTDCDYRGRWFGLKGSVGWRLKELVAMGVNVYHEDFRQRLGLVGGADLIVHCAGQASHDYSRTHVVEDFKINALGTVELLETTRNLAPKAVFAFMSTNKVYGDSINQETFKIDGGRFVPDGFPERKLGVSEFYPLDRSTHTPFGVSKTSADLMVQEYRHCFGMKTVSFRCGCMTGSGGTAVELQGFLGYLVKCAVAGTEYMVYGHNGYQVRDNIDAADVADAVLRYAMKPKDGVYNMGGGPENSISIREAVDYLKTIHGLEFPVSWHGPPRVGDHMYWVTNTNCFQVDYPGWTRKPIKEVIDDLVVAERARRGAPRPLHSGVSPDAAEDQGGTGPKLLGRSSDS